MIGQSASSLEFIRYRVVATVNGAAYNPTGDAVQFGFANSGSGPDVLPSTWLAGSWETDTMQGQTAYIARCLVGPGGTFAPSAGVYWVWLKITDSPEHPIRQVGQLTIY